MVGTVAQVAYKYYYQVHSVHILFVIRHFLAQPYAWQLTSTASIRHHWYGYHAYLHIISSTLVVLLFYGNMI